MKRIYNFLNAILLSILVCFILLILYRETYSVDFYPINGTFQNYNPIRRILNGQVPYRDFVIYLGLGHAFFGAILTYLFGGTFGASIIAIKLLIIIFSFSTLYILGIAILPKNKRRTAIILLSEISMFFLGLNSYIFNKFPNLGAAFYSALNTGNSARPIRAGGGYYLQYFYISYLKI